MKKSKDTKLEITFPELVECSVYRSMYVDLKSMSDDEVRHHYHSYGLIEGRIPNRIQTREDFANLVNPQKANLEIGPFASPLLKNVHTKYADILNTDELKVKAENLGIPPSLVPEIDHVVDPNFLEINDRFDNILSSHVIEHTVDLISHFIQIEETLNINGCYFLLIPDHRFCFDHFQVPSDFSDVITAYVERRERKTFKSVLNSAFYVTHNSPSQHWAGDHGSVGAHGTDEITELIDYYQNFSNSDFDDLHCWYFTPNSFSKILSQLAEMNFTKFRLERLYPTRKDTNEFWAILRKV